MKFDIEETQRILNECESINVGNGEQLPEGQPSPKTSQGSHGVFSSVVELRLI